MHRTMPILRIIVIVLLSPVIAVLIGVPIGCLVIRDRLKELWREVNK